jgi:hypothetical protein
MLAHFIFANYGEMRNKWLMVLRFSNFGIAHPGAAKETGFS